MDFKSIVILELPKVLDRMGKYAAFAASGDMAKRLLPTDDLSEARRRQAETSEARRLLSVKADTSVGGARDVRELVFGASKGVVLDGGDLNNVKATLLVARSLARTLSRLGGQFPLLSAIARGLAEAPGVIEAISQAIDERSHVMDSASERLAELRRELKVAQDRLMEKLQRLVADPRHGPYLQEAIITQREGRYVIPLKADFRGRIRGIVHDQSASGATLFVEPLATVELNNRVRELQIEEQNEIRRVLAALSAKVGEFAEQIAGAVDALAQLDLAFAKAKYADATRATEPELVELDAGRPRSSSVLHLVAARHPLLDPERVVPIDLTLDPETQALVITGPNTGGKTVSLKTAGLLALMAQCGLHLPVRDGSSLAVFRQVLADIGDEQSIEQSLSTFSSHVTNIIRLLGQADERSLVILDELGAGTDPAEGSALARAILAFLLDRGAHTLVATHYPELKHYALETPGVRNASVEFDPDTLQPTYRLTIGLPGRSNAFAIAQRLGLPEPILSDARSMVSTTDLESERLLHEIHRQRHAAEQARLAAEHAQAQSQAAEQALQARLDGIDAERRAILESARAEAQAELDELREEIRALKRRLAAVVPKEVREVEARVQELLDQAEEPVAGAPAPAATSTPRPLRLGSTVRVRPLNMEGVVTSMGTTDAEVQIGRLRVRARLEELESLTSAAKPATAPAPPASPEPMTRFPSAESPGMELHLRRLQVEDALIELERYIDRAYRAGLPWVRIVHGKGTGKLRRAVREVLRTHPLVASMESGKDSEGGEGVTVAKLVSRG